MFYEPIKRLIISIIHACITIFTLYSSRYYICFIAIILNTLYAFYVSLLYTCLSENSSDELMLPNCHVTDGK